MTLYIFVEYESSLIHFKLKNTFRYGKKSNKPDKNMKPKEATKQIEIYRHITALCKRRWSIYSMFCAIQLSQV